MLLRLFSVLLLLLTRDGVLHKFDGQHDERTPAPHATAVAIVDGKLALLADGKLTLDGKRVPGKFADVRALAGGRSLWGLAGERALRIDVKTGKREIVLEQPRLHRLAADGEDLFAETDGVIAQVGTALAWKLPSHPIALAAGDGKLYAATKEGPIWQIDRKTGEQHKLEGIGDWWGTIALAFADGQLWAVTLVGKIWKIDPSGPRGPTKTIVAMDGWQGAIDMTVLR